MPGWLRAIHGTSIRAGVLAVLVCFAVARGEADPPTTRASALLLTPELARIHGFKLHVEKEPKPALVYWVDPQEYVEWPRAVKRRGSYEVEITYACAPGAGGEFTLAAGASRIHGRTENTGNWQTYREQKIGTIRVVNDDTTLSLRPHGNINHALMNVRLVKLTPM